MLRRTLSFLMKCDLVIRHELNDHCMQLFYWHSGKCFTSTVTLAESLLGDCSAPSSLTVHPDSVSISTDVTAADPAAISNELGSRAT